MDEIEDLYLSGIASAKAGNRRLAQAFFKRVIGINPRHEGAWLWLSEALDDPDDIAYCLEAVLALNSDNEKARLALELVRKRGSDPRRSRRPQEWSPLAELREMDLPAILAETPPPTTPVAEAVEGLERAPTSNPMQAFWRVLFIGAVLAVLTLSIYFYSSIHPPAVVETPAADAPIPTVDRAALDEKNRQEVQDYLAQLDEAMGAVRLAHDVYRGQVNLRPSLSFHVDLTGRLLTQVVSTRERLQRLAAPELLAEAHQEYVQGFILEEEALDSLLRFAESYHTGYATGYASRASVKFQEAGARLARARAICAQYRDWAEVPEPTRLPTPTPITTPTYGLPPTVTPTYPPIPTLTPSPFPTQPIG